LANFESKVITILLLIELTLYFSFLKDLTNLNPDRSLCQYALEQHHFDIEAASNWLVQQVEPLRKKRNLASSKQESKGLFGFLKKSNSSTAETSHYPQLLSLNEISLKDLIKSGNHQLAVALALHKNQLSAEKAISELMDSGYTFPNFEQVLGQDFSDSHRNFMLEMVVYLVRRIATSMGHCLVSRYK
jgi:hypothetical protein